MKTHVHWLSTALIVVPAILVGCGGGKTPDVSVAAPSAAEDALPEVTHADVVPPAPTGEAITAATAASAAASAPDLGAATAPVVVTAPPADPGAGTAVTAPVPEVAAPASGAASAPGAPASRYGALRNQSLGNGMCLALSDNGRKIQWSPCADDDRQKWSFDGTGPYKIRNKWSAAQGKTPCLAAPLGMMTCQKKDGGGGYDSQRTWGIRHEPAGTFSLLNKYTEPLVLRPSDVPGGLGFFAAAGDAANRWSFDGPMPDEQRPPVTRVHALVVATHFEGIPPADPERIRKAVLGDGKDFASLQHHVFLSSGGKLAITGQMVTDVNLGPVPTGCPSLGTFVSAAKKAALARGVNPDDFTHTFVDFSYLRACNSFAGMAESPGTGIISNGVGYKFWMWGHEFGHNLGGGHPRATTKCPVIGNVVQLGAQCEPGAIDDPTDPLGGGGRRLFPAHYLLHAGWLPGSAVPWINTAGTYTLAPLWSKEGAQGFRIARAGGTYLLLEFRQPSPGFEDWAADSPFVNGVIVRTVAAGTTTISHSLVDTTPGSTAKDMSDAPLMPGRSLHDSASGATVTVKSVGPKGAVVEVSFAQ